MKTKKNYIYCQNKNQCEISTIFANIEKTTTGQLGRKGCIAMHPNQLCMISPIYSCECIFIPGFYINV